MGLLTKEATQSPRGESGHGCRSAQPMARRLAWIEHELMSPNTQSTEEICYYISCLDANDLSAVEIGYYIREHWGVRSICIGD